MHAYMDIYMVIHICVYVCLVRVQFIKSFDHTHDIRIGMCCYDRMQQ